MEFGKVIDIDETLPAMLIEPETEGMNTFWTHPRWVALAAFVYEYE